MIRRLKRFKFDLSFPCMQPKVFQRLGETQATDIEVQVLSEGVPYNLTGVRFGFEMRDDEGKIVIDENQSRFTLTDSTNGKFTYRVDDKVFGFDGNAYLCYFVLKISGIRITTERFIITNDEDVQKHTSGLREHYVSVIDDLVASNKAAMEEANKIKDMIEANQVVKKTGDTMTGNLSLDRTDNTVTRDLRWTTGGSSDVYVGLDNAGLWRAYATGLGMIFSYNKNTKEFNVPGDTNLLKKSEMYSGWISPSGASKSINDTDLNTVLDAGIYTGQRLINAPENITSNFFYIEVLPYTNNQYRLQRATLLNHANTRVWERALVSNVWQPWKKILTDGDIYVDMVQQNGNTLLISGSNADDIVKTGNYSGNNITNQPLGSGIVYLTVYSHSPSYTRQEVRTANDHAGLVYERKRVSSVWGAWTEVSSRGKDGKADILPSANADATAGVTQFALRRGNTVTMSIDLTRKTGTTSNVVATLPTSMRPPIDLFTDIVAVDGSPARLLIKANGEIQLNVTGKQFRTFQTYTVD